MNTPIPDRWKILTAAAVFVLGYAVIVISDHFIGPKGTVTLSHHLASKSKGQPGAPVWVVEYADFQCPACARGAAALDELFAKHPSRLYLQARYYPLDNHVHGRVSAVHAECAAKQGKYWEYSELLFKNQDQWSALQDAEPAFKEFADQLKLDRGRFDACTDSAETDITILEQKKEASELGVRITPTYFINGKMVAGSKEMQEEMKRYFPEEAAP